MRRAVDSRANIRDVARAAGVSVTTVSHTLNRTRFVSEDARTRVEDAVRALGYVPSAVARSLKHNETRTLGMLVPNSSNPYFAEIIRSVERQCHLEGYNLVLCNSDDDVQRQAEHLRMLAERRVDGLVFVASGDDAQVREALAELQLPVVLVDREIDGSGRADLVQSDHASGAELATRHLLSLGHERIVCIGGPVSLRPSQQREAGWQRALVTAGQVAGTSEVIRGDFTAQGGYAAMHHLLGLRARPSAVFVCNDMMAIGALHAVQQAGLAVPRQLSVVGFDDIDLAAYTMPPLTTVAQPKEAIGAETTRLLLERIRGERGEARRTILQPELRLRASTGRPAAQ
ncbi:MAG TPA: LacI family DNA-binding transcriptional regulator [Burkholderiaceae bacterium]|nr:LacI family DNA-binding transcriptional regulator [Burkholderiaceae bacterium]